MTALSTPEQSIESQAAELLQAQRAYFATGATLPIEFRLTQLKRLQSAIIERQDEIVEAVTSPETARQVYAASVIAVDVDTEAERDYLKRLAAGLQLDAAEVDRMHEKLDAPKL